MEGLVLYPRRTSSLEEIPVQPQRKREEGVDSEVSTISLGSERD